MLSNERIIKKFQNFTKEKNDRFFGFWDMVNRTLTLRIFTIAAFTRKDVTTITHVKEVIRFAPNGLTDRENWTDRDGKHHNGRVKEYLWENSLYYHNFTNRWLAAMSNDDKITLPVTLTKFNKPFQTLKHPYWVGPTNWNTWNHDAVMVQNPNIYFKDITEYMQTPSIIKKLSQIKLKEGKTNAPVLSLISGEYHNLKELYNYLLIYKKYQGIKVLYDNHMYHHLNDKFLDLLGVNENHPYSRFYLKTLTKNIDKVKMLNTTNLKKAYEGVNIETLRLIKNFRTQLTIMSKEVTATELKQETIKTVRTYIKELRWISKYEYKAAHFLNNAIHHYIDYLMYKHEERGGLTKAIYLNPNWNREYDAVIAEINSLNAKQKQLKFEEENKHIASAVEEMADMIGLKEIKLKNKKELNKYVIGLPKNIQDYNEQGTSLIHCYKNNQNYLNNHVDRNEVLIFIEKDGERYATATLHPDGKITQFHLHKNIDVEGYEKNKLSEVIKKEILPGIIQFNKNIENRIGDHHEA